MPKECMHSYYRKEKVKDVISDTRKKSETKWVSCKYKNCCVKKIVKLNNTTNLSHKMCFPKMFEPITFKPIIIFSFKLTQ